MKYQSATSFQKQLQEAFPGHLAHIYLVASPHECDRRKWIEMTLDVLRRKEGSCSPLFYSVGSVPLGEVFEQLATKPLLGSEVLLVFDGIEKLKGKALDQLLAYVEAPSPFATLVLGASSLKGCPELYERGKMEMVMLDLTAEKPWDREKRICHWLCDEARRKGKLLSPDLGALMAKRVGLDMALLSSELEKLICYVGARPKIERDDLFAITSLNPQTSGWNTAEAVVWGGGDGSSELPSDLSSLLPLVGQIRFQLEQGWQISSQLSCGRSSSEVAALFPQLRPARFEKMAHAARKLGPAYFQKGLQALFDLEWACKSSSVAPLLLFNHFILKLRHAHIHACMTV
jgi:DNA polymerase III subunit delta